jgi:site-specific recombinase XerD
MSRFTFNFYNDIRKPLKSGLYSIKVNMYDGAEKRGINFTIKKVNGIEVSCSKKDWLDIWVNKDKKNNFGDVTGETTVYGHKQTIRTILKAKEDILNDIINFDGIVSLEAVKDAFYNYTLPTSYTDDVYKEFENKIDELEQAKRYKTRDTYDTTLKNIKKYNIDRAFRFSDITVFWLDEYARAKEREGKKVASIAIDMRNIKAVYNKVKKGDAYLMENYPFGSGKNLYTIQEGTARNVGLDKEGLKKIKNFKSDNLYLQEARDVFLFSFYFGGMNWKDLILLTPKNIDEEYFIRAKTKFTTKKETHIPIKINDVQREIVERYRGKGRYLFNFLNETATEEDIYKVQNNGVSRLNKQLKKLAKKLNINEGLSYNWARHSFATTLHKVEGVSEKSIQESMGHTDARTTRKYIDSLADKERDAIDKALNLDD